MERVSGMVRYWDIPGYDKNISSSSPNRDLLWKGYQGMSLTHAALSCGVPRSSIRYQRRELIIARNRHIGIRWYHSSLERAPEVIQLRIYSSPGDHKPPPPGEQIGM